MAISTRKVLSGAVTDVLVLRGNDEVVHSTVNNPGAEFSERCFTRLVSRAEGDDELATCLGLRPARGRCVAGHVPLPPPAHPWASLSEPAGERVRHRAAAA